MERYEQASGPYLDALRRLPRDELALPQGHEKLVELAERFLPNILDAPEQDP